MQTKVCIIGPIQNFRCEKETGHKMVSICKNRKSCVLYNESKKLKMSTFHLFPLISIHQTYVVRIWITFSASVIDCKIPFAMFSRLLLFSVMLKIVFGRKVSLSSSWRVDIIFDIILDGTLASYKIFTWKSNIHIEYIPIAMV